MPLQNNRPTRLQRLLCKDCFAAAEASAPTPSTTPAITPEASNPDGVAALLTIATDALKDERERGRSLDAKTATIAGFTGLILSLNGAIAKPLFDAELGSLGEPVARVCFFVAIAALLVGVLLAIVGVLMPQRYRGMGRSQVRAFYSLNAMAKPAMEVHQSMLGSIADIIDQDRPVNDCKARITKLVAGCLAVGFVAVAGEALTLGARQIGV